MEVTLEIIERSIYDAILQVAIKEGLTLNPNDYYPVTSSSLEQFKTDKKAIEKYVTIFGTGSPESKGEKVTPRIVIENETLFPGSLGLNPSSLELNDEGEYNVVNYPSKTLEQIVSIYLCSGKQSDHRILQSILSKALPIRGYIKNYLNESLQDGGNIYLELVNAYDISDNATGIIEKVIQYQVSDLVITDSVFTSEDTIPMISDITIIANNQQLINITKTI